MWMDDYIKMVEGTEFREMTTSNFGDERVAAIRADVTANWDMFTAELKKMNNNLSDLKRCLEFCMLP
jgi:hypothetical protein